MEKKIKITLVKSLIGRLPKHVLIANQLGLRKINRSVVHHDIPSIRGLVHVIEYMLSVEECV